MSIANRAAEERGIGWSGDILFAGRKPLPRVQAWYAANRDRFKPGTFTQIIIAHDAHCRYPAGEDCTCVAGPEISVDGVNPEGN
jgi:hypothetical protein